MKKSLYSLRNYKKELILGPMFKVVEVIFELIIPFLMKYIINEGVNYANDGNIKHILIPGGIIILFCILGFASTFVCQYFASIASQGFGTDLRNRIFNKINNLNLIDLEEFNKGNLVNIINNDANRVQLMIAMIIRLVIRAPILVIGSLICSFIIDYRIGIIFVIIVPIISLILGCIMYFNSKSYIKIQNKLDKVTTFNNDTLKGSRVIRAFNKIKERNDEYLNITNDYFNDVKKVNLISSLVNPLTFLIINIAIMLVLYFGGNFMYFGELTDGDIVALISYLNQIFVALIVVSNLVIIFTKAFSSKNRIDKLLMYESKVQNYNEIDEIKIKKSEKIIEFCNVNFKYNDSENNVLENINFTINKGELIGIIGGTGSGKTTIIKLIERFFDVTSGEILYKNENIKKYNLINLRNEIGLVDQNNLLFKGTIKTNLLVGNEKANDENIIDSLKKAEAYDFVSKYEDFLDHEILENGKNLSGGQKQRLCLARALIKNKEILIMDDSTSALDYITDSNVRNNIKKEKDLTTIIISQRISSIHDCDKIIVIDNGKINSIGTHDELLNKSKLYLEIYQSQNKE